MAGGSRMNSPIKALSGLVIGYLWIVGELEGCGNLSAGVFSIVHSNREEVRGHLLTPILPHLTCDLISKLLTDKHTDRLSKKKKKDRLKWHFAPFSLNPKCNKSAKMSEFLFHFHFTKCTSSCGEYQFN